MPFLDWFLPCFYAFAACLGFCVPFNIRGLGAVICSLGGGLAWLVYLIAGPLTGYHDLMQYFWAAVFLSAYSEGMARVRKCPVTGYMLVAFLPSQFKTAATLILLIALIFIPYVYSYLAFRQEKKNED